MELLKIETPRLLLRQFTIGDAEDVFAILSDEQTTLDCGGYHAFEEMDEEYEEWKKNRIFAPVINQQ